MADHSEAKRLAIDETSRAKGHEYVTLAADAERRAIGGIRAISQISIRLLLPAWLTNCWRPPKSQSG
jgi:transposase